MTLLAEPAGRSLERTGNRVSRGMIVHDRTRLIGQLLRNSKYTPQQDPFQPGYRASSVLVALMNLRILLILGWIYALSGCATFALNDPLRISVAGMEPLEGKGMEARFAVQLRVQNHSDKPLDYDGVALDLDLRGMSFASGVSDQRGTIPRYGETIITVPVTVPATAIIRHVFGFATGDRTRADYRLRGELGGPGFGGGRSFDSQGEITLPTVPPESRQAEPLDS